jgi:hypothetical protein
MTRTLFALATLGLAACASEGQSDDTGLGFTVDAKDAPAVRVPSLPVRYVGGEEGVIVAAMRTLPDGSEQILAGGQVVDGEAMLRLPPSAMNPPEARIPQVSFRVVARRQLPDGKPGEIIDVADSLLVFAPAHDAVPAAWMLVDKDDQDVIVRRQLPTGVELGDRVRYNASVSVGGGIAPGLSDGRFALTLLTDGDALLPAYNPPEVVLEGSSWSMLASGPPPRDTLLTEDGVASGRFWPVAWSDADGITGLDPAADDLLGMACVPAGVVSLIWSPAPMKLGQALGLLEKGLRAGWSVRIDSPDGLLAPTPGMTPWISGDCG